MTETIVDFDHPPVTEVICGIGFKKIPGLQAPRMGLFWESIRKEFPIAEVKPPIASPGQVAGLSFVEGDDLPMRFFLRSEDRRELVQIQPERLLFNWLKTDDGDVYPRYRGVMKRFGHVRRKFSRFLKEHEMEAPAIRELRLEYLNHIPRGVGWKVPGDVGRLFPDFKLRRRNRRYLKEPYGFSITSRHPVAHEQSYLDMSLRTGARTDQEAIVLQLSVIGNVADPSEKLIQAWFDMARQAINLSFVDLASQDAKNKIWGIHEH